VSDGQTTYPVIDVTSWRALGPEVLGTKRKQWLEHPDDGRWLFKVVRAKTMPTGELRVFGEDWSEKLAREIGLLLGVPVPEVHLARRTTAAGVVQRGSLVRNFLAGDEALAHGNELLQQADPSYDKDRTREVPGYTLDAIWAALDGFGPPSGMPDPPSGMPDPLVTAADAFAGYLVFDALIANTDRNHENWAAVMPLRGPPRLAPSFDHATSLGFQEPADRKNEWLADPDAGSVRRWVERGQSSHFEGKPGLVELACTALRDVSPAAAAYWRERVASLSPPAWGATIGAVPADLLSQPDRIFASEIVRLNRERLLDACWTN
jgi:hypothetical protein